MRATSLTCEYQVNPLGIDVLSPRLSWKCSSSRRGAHQTAYQVVAEGDQGILWDSGKVLSDQSILVEYQGVPLHSAQAVSWKVRVWDESDQPDEFSDQAGWEMGLLRREDWNGQWIGSQVTGGPRTSAPCPYLRGTFRVDRQVHSARLYVTALGLYEFYLNGQRVGVDVFSPGWTDFRKRVQYQVYDATSLLRGGENALGAVLGDGWYCGFVANLNRQNYGDRPRLLAQLVIRYSDGSSETVATGPGWRTSSGPILESDMIMGEAYDARMELGRWSEPGYDDQGWQPAAVFADPEIALTSKRNPPVRRQEELLPVTDPTVKRPEQNTRDWIFDLGQNMVGWVRLKIHGPAGTTVRLRYTEALNPDGSLYTTALRSARATDYYTLKGEGVEIYEPRFTFHGFRYVELSGYAGEVNRETIIGVVLHSDIQPTGSFECSDPLINQLLHNIQWSQKGNFLEVPTDCPQRDERLGWTGDAQVFIRTATFNRDVAAFFTKWQQDIADSQSAIGQIPPVVPRVSPFGLSNDGGPAWADAGVICPWTIYLAYGDRRLLAEHYVSMQAFVEYLRSSSLDLIRVHPRTEWKDGNWPGFGDWLSTRAETPNDLIGTAFFAYSAGLMSKIAAVLGKKEDAIQYVKLADEVRQAFIHRYVTRDGLVASQTQTAYVLGLYFDLIPAQLRENALDELVEDIKKRGWRLSTGFVGTPYLLQTLTQAGRIDVAYRLLYQKSWPSWLYPVTQGATTIWERWDGWTQEKGFQDPGMNSFNHYAYGAVGAWIYTTIAGIDLDQQRPGYQHVLLHPRPDENLTCARAEYESPYGKIVSDWQQENGVFSWKVTVPANAGATAWVPREKGAQVYETGKPAEQAEGMQFIKEEENAVVYQLTSGEYHFEVRG